MTPRRIITICGFLSSVCWPLGSALAADTTTEMGVTLRGSYEDNARLEEGAAQELYRGAAIPTFSIISESARSRLEVRSSASFVKSSDDTIEVDRIDYDFGLLGEYRMETAVWSVDLASSKQSVRDTEFDDTGRFATDAKRRRHSANVAWQQELSELTSVTLSGDYQKVIYSSNNFRDFWNGSARLSLDRRFSERLTIGINAAAQRFRPEGPLSIPRDFYRAGLGGTYAFSDRTTINFSAGAVYFDDDIENRVSVSGSVSLTHQTEFMTLSLNASRDISPSGDGVLRQSTSAGGSLAYQLTETLDFGFNAAYRTSDFSELAGQGDTEMINASPRIGWKVTQNIRAQISYRWRRLNRDTFQDWVTSNSAFLEIGYKF